MIFAYGEESARFAAARAADPKISMPFVCVVDIDPERVSVSQLCAAPEMALAKQFVTWLLSRYRCTVTDDEGNDLTEAAA